MSNNFKFVQAQDFSLAGAGAIAGATSLVLKSFKQIDGTTLLTMADFGTIGFATLEPGNGALEEQISFTGVTQNGNGTATLTGVSTVLFVSPYTATSGLAKTHAGSTSLIISNTAGFYDQLVGRNDDATITGLWNFPNNANYPTIGTVYSAPTTDLQIATKKYVDDTVVAGAPKATNVVYGLVKLSVAAASATVPIAVGDNDNRVSPVSLATVTANIVAALAGTGTPNGTTGKYVTNDDTSATPSANKVIRYGADGSTPGIINTFTFGETITAGQPVYLKESDMKVYKASSAAANELLYNYIGIAAEAGNANDVKKVYTGNGIVATIADLGALTTAISSTKVINQTTSTATQIILYNGVTPGTLFKTISTQGNIEKIDVTFSAKSGTGGGNVTLTLYEVTGYTNLTTLTSTNLGNITVNGPSSFDGGTVTFTFSSPITVKPNTNYFFILTASAGDGSNHWNLPDNSSAVDASYSGMNAVNSVSSGYGGTVNGKIMVFAVYSTLTLNYYLGDYLYLGDTAGTVSLSGGTKKLVLGKIVSSTTMILGMPETRRLILTGSTPLGAGSNGAATSIPIPRNTVEVRVQMTGTNAHSSYHFKIGEVESIDNSVGDSGNSPVDRHYIVGNTFGRSGVVSFTNGGLTLSDLTISFYK